MNQPLVSIIINNYNYGTYINAAIDSALKQTYPNIEIIVVDDGSTDSSPEIIKSYEHQIKAIFKSNGGQASAFNAGFAASCGDIICFLDSDDMFLPSKVEEIVKAFIHFQDIDWVFHPLFDVKTEILQKEDFQILSYIQSEDAKFIDENNNTYVEIDFRKAIKDGRQPRFVPQTSALSFSRKVMSKIFPIPEDQKTYVGDTYVAMACVFLSKGCVIGKRLSLYRLHGYNAYSNESLDKSRETFANLHIVTSYRLLTNFPEFSKYINTFFSKGLACFWCLKNTDVRYKKFIKDYFKYLPINQQALVIVKSFYYFCKSLIFKCIP